MEPSSSGSTRRFAILVALGALASLWALFQWGELVAARAGATPFCALGGSFDCAAVWDSGFARAVHDATKIPVAGWGLMWGLVAFALPLLVLAAPEKLGAGVGSGMRLTAIAGGVSVVGLAGATIVAQHVCLGCLGTYAIVLAWSALAWVATREPGLKEPQKGVMYAGGLVVAAYLVLLYPGLNTPHALVDAGKDAMRKSVATNPTNPANPTGPTGPTAPTVAPKTVRFDGQGTGDPGRDEQLARFLESLGAEERQIMSDLLAFVQDQKPSTAMPQTRVVIGSKDAPVKFVDFTDPLCGHCAALHGTFEEVEKYVGNATFSVEPHYFPLDGACNPTVERKWDTDIRCQAVRAQLCLEEDPAKLAQAQHAIFENQQGLTADRMWEVLKPFGDRKKLEACMKSPETQKKLAADIAAANALHLEGTPLLYMNGKELKPFGPLLFALILTNGSTTHPAFASLPAPKPLPAHDHQH
jgi:serine/threonine-protein kinase